MKQIIVKPHITEKSMLLAQKGLYTFKVLKSSDKGQIASQISEMFKVDVKGVHVISMHGKVKRTGRRQIKKTTSDWKKAIVKLKEGQTIDAFQVVKDDSVKK